MTSPLDGNGVAAAEAAFNASINNPQMVPCSKCEGRGFHHGFGEDGNDPDWCTECGGSQFNVVPGEETRAIEAAIAAYLASAAPSQTAVEPVAAELAMLVNWLPKLIAALGSKPEHVDDVARLARVHALIPTLTAQAAALVAAERDRDELQAQVNGLSAKCASLAPHGECACSYDTPDDLCLHHSPKLTAAESEVATLKARVAELEAGLEDVFRLNDECSGSEPSISVLMRAIDDLRARRLTHQEKNNGR